MGFDCCGIAGTYGYKHEKHAIAQAVGQPLFDKLNQSASHFAVCDNETCRWNLAANTGLRVVHTAQILAASYGLPGCQLLKAPARPPAADFLRAHADRVGAAVGLVLAAGLIARRAGRR